MPPPQAGMTGVPKNIPKRFIEMTMNSNSNINHGKAGIYDFRVYPFHCDFSNHIMLGHLGNDLLNAADFHSNDNGYGVTTLQKMNRTWVLSRLAIEMDELPAAYVPFQIETWLDSALRYFTSRNFTVTGKDGKVYGHAHSVWAMIDTVTRQPCDISTIDNGAVFNYVDEQRPPKINKCGRVAVGKEAPFIRSIDTYYSDIDVNGHVNSIRYIEHVLDLFSLEYLRTHRIKRFEVAYVAETHQGDRLHIYKEEHAGDTYGVRLMRTTPGSDQQTEVCRCCIQFADTAK